MNRAKNPQRRRNFRFPPAPNSEFDATFTTPKSPTTEGDKGSELISSAVVGEAPAAHVKLVGTLPSKPSAAISSGALHKSLSNSTFPFHRYPFIYGVKFAASKKDSPSSCRLEDSYIPSEREKKVITYDDPKTSEYAFFKKLKKDAGVRFHSRPLQKDVSLVKKPEPTDCSRERTYNVRVGSKGFNTSGIIEALSTVNTDSFLSPSDGAWNKSELYSVSCIQKNSQGYGDTFEPHGNPNVHGEIFSRKRKKLRQFVADALFPDTEKFSLKGHDIVPMLLSRLFPMSIEENEFEDPNPGKEAKATGYYLPDSRDTDVLLEEHDQIPLRKLFEQSSSCFGDNLLSPMLLNSDERITAHTAFPSSHSHNFQPTYSITEPEYNFGITPHFSSKCDLNLGILYNGNGVMNATGYGLLDSQESDIRFNDHRQIPETKLLEFEPNSCIRDHLLSPIFLRSNERVFPHADFPTSHSHEFQPLCSITEPECEFGRISSFRARSDVTIKLLSNEKEHDTLTLNHFKELGKLEREPIPLLLERDFDCPTDETNLPNSYKYAKPDNVVPALSTSGNDGQYILKNILGEYQLGPSSFLFDKPHDITSILDSGLLRCQESRFGNYVNEDEDEMESNFNHTVLLLSHDKHCFKLSADCKEDTSVQDNCYLSPNQHWIKRTAYDDYQHHPDSEAWLSSSLNFISGQRCLSLTSSHSNYLGSGSSTLQFPQRENMFSLFRTNDNFKTEIDGGNQGDVLYHFREGLIEICNSSFLHTSMQRENGFPLPLDGSDNINELEEKHYDPLES